MLGACFQGASSPEETPKVDTVPVVVKKDTVIIPELNSKDSVLFFRIHYLNQDFKVSRFPYERIEDMVYVNLLVAEDIKRQYYEGGYGEEVDKKMAEMERNIKDQAEILENDMGETALNKDMRKTYRKLIRKCERFTIKEDNETASKG
jgi:hypothetical protein